MEFRDPVLSRDISRLDCKVYMLGHGDDSMRTALDVRVNAAFL